MNRHVVLQVDDLRHVTSVFNSMYKPLQFFYNLGRLAFGYGPSFSFFFFFFFQGCRWENSQIIGFGGDVCLIEDLLHLFFHRLRVKQKRNKICIFYQILKKVPTNKIESFISLVIPVIKNGHSYWIDIMSCDYNICILIYLLFWYQIQK